MMIYQIVYEPEALISLEQIAIYYADVGGYELAESIVSRIQANIDGLENLPERFPKTEFSKEIRKLAVTNLPFVVYFSVKENKVFVLEILHSSRNHNPFFESLK